MVLSCASPMTLNSPAGGGKRGCHRRQDAAIQQLEAGEFDQTNASRRPPTALEIHEQVNQLAL